jgi:hypothetical protein
MVVHPRDSFRKTTVQEQRLEGCFHRSEFYFGRPDYTIGPNSPSVNVCFVSANCRFRVTQGADFQKNCSSNEGELSAACCSLGKLAIPEGGFFDSPPPPHFANAISRQVQAITQLVTFVVVSSA